MTTTTEQAIEKTVTIRVPDLSWAHDASLPRPVFSRLGIDTGEDEGREGKVGGWVKILDVDLLFRQAETSEDLEFEFSPEGGFEDGMYLVRILPDEVDVFEYALMLRDYVSAAAQAIEAVRTALLEEFGAQLATPIVY